jgi:Holliday junction resolvase-like predicted endonuclease
MASGGRESIRFTLNGDRFELSRADVDSRLIGVVPDTIRKHAVRVNGTWYPAIQAFEMATGVPRSQFISHTARRHLASLGYEVAGEIESRDGTSARLPSSPPMKDAISPDAYSTRSEEWHTEANIQAAVVTALASDGWRILSVANTATKEHCVDVIASRGGETVGVEVKGFPSRGYADPARAHETKRTAPSTQAGHWYAQAVLAAMRLRGKEPTWRSVIALPDFSRYRALHEETAGSLAAAQIGVWWVDEVGAVDRNGVANQR